MTRKSPRLPLPPREAGPKGSLFFSPVRLSYTTISCIATRSMGVRYVFPGPVGKPGTEGRGTGWYGLEHRRKEEEHSGQPIYYTGTRNDGQRNRPSYRPLRYSCCLDVGPRQSTHCYFCWAVAGSSLLHFVCCHIVILIDGACPT
jgi:hypothetical protein